MIFTWIVFIERRNQKIVYCFTKPRRRHIRKTNASKENKGVLHFPLVTPWWACLPLTLKQWSQEKQPTTQIPHRPMMSLAHKIVWYTRILKKKKRNQIKKQTKEDNKIKLHKIFMWIYLQVLICIFLNRLQLCYIKAKHSQSSAHFLYNMQVSLLSFPLEVELSPISLLLEKSINTSHSLMLTYKAKPQSPSITLPCSTTLIRTQLTFNSNIKQCGYMRVILLSYNAR